MPLNIRAFIEILAELCEKYNLKVALKESLKGTLITGAASLVGGLLLGRNGLLVGGLIGTICTTLSSPHFISAAEVLRKMKPSERKILYEKVKVALSDFTFEDAVAFTYLMKDPSVQNLALNIVTEFITQKGYGQIKQ